MEGALPATCTACFQVSLACCLGAPEASPQLAPKIHANTVGAQCAIAATEARKRVERENLRLLDRITELNERRRIDPLQRNIACAVPRTAQSAQEMQHSSCS